MADGGFEQPRVSLHDYQREAINRLRSSLAGGKKHPMLAAPTGAGKTVISGSIVDSALAKGKRVAFAVPALSLVDQTCTAFERYGIPADDIGVMQATHWRRAPHRPVQVCSLQTLDRRGFPEVDLVLVDEAHEVHRSVIRWMKEAPQTVFIGLSATPWAKGLGKLYDDLITVATTQQLIDWGYLSPFRVFAPETPDLSCVRVKAGEFDKGQLSDAMSDEGLVGNVVANWLENGEGRPTLCFGVDRAHAKSLQRRFEAAGVSCGYIDANTPTHDRDEIARQFHVGHLQVVCNIGTLTKGVDWDVRCLILARPTKSPMLHVQIIGRALRTAPGKADALIFDHAGNCARLGFPTDIYRDKLDDGKRNQSGKRASEPREAPKPTECTKCSFLRPARVNVCPACGHVHEHKRDVQEAEGQLVELNPAKVKADMAEKQRWFSGLLHIATQRGYSPGWAAHKYREKFGVWPNHCEKVPSDAAADIRRWVQAKQIRWAKGKERGAA